LSNYVCIHGHFYQPPRENPFTGTVSEQPTAAPWHDWNERITEECYAANTKAAILDESGSVVRTVSTYDRISFDFGPTLLIWLEENAPDTYRAIIEADASSAARFGGHGSAIAQAYNHIILPLANHRDKVTQVRWGIADFEHRFGRRPDGMWLPETAVDSTTLEILAGAKTRRTEAGWGAEIEKKSEEVRKVAERLYAGLEKTAVEAKRRGWIERLHTRQRGVPYALALAVGGLIAAPSSLLVKTLFIA